MRREFHVRFCERAAVGFLRATHLICHCKSAEEARALWVRIADRFAACKLVLHPQMTKIVYCKDVNRRSDFPDTYFDFLGFQFRAPKDHVGEGGQAHLRAQFPTRPQPEGVDAHRP